MPDQAAPLTPLSFAILLAVAEAPMHGYAILKDLEAEWADGGDRIGTGSLYAALQRMVDEGLLAPAPPPDPSEDRRRRYYAITPLGRETARSEAIRMALALQQARERSILPELRLLLERPE